MKDTTIREALGGGIKFHEDLPRMNKEELIAAEFVLWDARVVDDWDGSFGVTQFCLVALELEDGKKITSLMGGKAIVRQVGKLLRLGKLPGRIRCVLNKVPSKDGSGREYYLLDEPAKSAVEQTVGAQG